MLGKKENISISIKLFSGIHKMVTLDNVDTAGGVCLKMERGKRLKHALKKIGLKNRKELVFFRNNIRINNRTKLEDGDVISCLKVSGGG